MNKFTIVSRGIFSINGKKLPGPNDYGFHEALINKGFGEILVKAGKYPVNIDVKDGERVLVWEKDRYIVHHGPKALFLSPKKVRRVKV